MVRCANGQAPPRRLVPCRSNHREDQNVRLTPKSSPAQRRNYRRLIQQPTSPRSLFPPFLNEPSVGALLWREGSKVAMSQRAEHYRGYVIDGNAQGRDWSVEVHPDTPDLPFFDEPLFA